MTSTPKRNGDGRFASPLTGRTGLSIDQIRTDSATPPAPPVVKPPTQAPPK